MTGASGMRAGGGGRLPFRALPRWTPDLAVGDEQIDAQHRRLFDQAAALHDAIVAGAPEARVLETLGFLGDYVLEHFAAEEALMARLADPGAAAHAAEHARFRARHSALARTFATAGASRLTAEIVRCDVLAWLAGHVAGTDLALRSLLRGRAG